MYNTFYNLKKVIWAVVLLSTVTACTDSKTGNDDKDDLLSAIQGVWELNSQDGDISFIHVDDKIVNTYDFMGDDYDEGPECYLFTESKIEKIEGDEVTFEYDGFQITARISIKNNVLSISQNFGNIEFTELFNKSNSNVNSFEPICEDFEF